MEQIKPKTSRGYPAKRFAIPADIRALGNYGVAIVEQMKHEHTSRGNK